jgi:hypothetical protein
MSTGTTGTGTGSTINVGADPLAGKQTGTESSLSNWAGPYVTEMLGKGQALSNMPYQAYTGTLTAGPSALQSQAFQGIGGLNIPSSSMTAFTPQSFTDTGVAQRYMNPYLMQALQPQIDEARRQAEIQRVQDAGRLTRAGAYGGGRQAVMEGAGARGLLANLANITGQGYKQAYDTAATQFNTEQQQRQQSTTAAQNYGLSALQKQADLGAQQRDIEQQGISADIKQFEQERDFPYKQVQYQQSLLQGLPVAAQSYTYAQPSALSELLGGAGGLMSLYDILFGGKK